jgi:hypothetical protein
MRAIPPVSPESQRQRRFHRPMLHLRRLGHQRLAVLAHRRRRNRRLPVRRTFPTTKPVGEQAQWVGACFRPFGRPCDSPPIRPVRRKPSQAVLLRRSGAGACVNTSPAPPHALRYSTLSHSNCSTLTTSASPLSRLAFRMRSLWPGSRPSLRGRVVVEASGTMSRQ